MKLSKTAILYPKRFSDASKIHIYCPKCGCEVEKLLRSTNSFSIYSGKEKYILELLCLNKKYWWDKHTSEEMDKSINSLGGVTGIFYNISGNRLTSFSIIQEEK
jgi:hypothetical protein